MFRTFNRELCSINRWCSFSSHVKRCYGTTVVKNVADDSYARPYSDIPMVKGLPVIGTLLEWASNMEKIHEIPQKRLKQYGPIYREKIGFDKHRVFTANLDDWKEICRGELRGSPAVRSKIWPLSAYNEKRKLPTPTTELNDEEYTRIKSSVKSLLMPVEIAKIIPMLSDVTDDLILSLEAKMKDDGVVENIRQLIQLWTLECGGTIVCRTRLHLLSQQLKDKGRPVKLLEAIQDWFMHFGKLLMALPHHKLLLSKLWRDFENASDKMHVLANHYFDEHGEHVTDKTVDMTDAERRQIATTVLVASGDTTAHSALWVLIVLSNNPDIQERLYEEITKIYDGEQLTYQHIQLPYLRGFLKEVFRVKPILPFLPRVLAEDLVLSGYHVPAGTTVNMLLGAYDENAWYSDAQLVRPERWMRERKKDSGQPSATCPVKHHSFGVLPFGYGRRSCLGKRLAESELYLLIAKMVYRYKIHPVKKYDSRYNVFVTPDGEIDVKLEKRD